MVMPSTALSTAKGCGSWADATVCLLPSLPEVHPELADNEFFVTGESYAGHYVPAVASAVYRARELGHGPRINLKV